MYFIQKELYNLSENRIPKLRYNEEDFFKWLINIFWQDEERNESDMWNMHFTSPIRTYERIQMLMHIYGLNLDDFEKIINSIDRDMEYKLEEKYSKEYDRKNNDNVFIYMSVAFSGFRFLFTGFVNQLRLKKIPKLIVCKDCGEIFFEEQKNWEEKGLDTPKRCTNCRKKRKFTGKNCVHCGKPLSVYDEENAYYAGYCFEDSQKKLRGIIEKQVI